MQNILIGCLLILSLEQVWAADPNAVEIATQRGLARVKQAASDWQGNQSCFSCHHQTLPMLAAVEARKFGFALDAAWLKSQADTTLEYFGERTDDMDVGAHVPGGAATTGFGFWALSLDNRPADTTTTSMVKYLLQIQGFTRLRDAQLGTAVNDQAVTESAADTEATKVNDGHWQASCRRAPMQASSVGDTVLVLIGLEKYATPEQRVQVDQARLTAEKWMSHTPLRNQQDRLWRLWGLHHLDGDAELKQRVTQSIMAEQRDDGGWAETKDRQSDAYSTGQTLYMLLKTGLSVEHAAVLRARDYLLETQHADGSWLAESHVKFKAQPYFENGDPHGEHQFLSTAATAWATAGLVQLLPVQVLEPVP